MKKTLLFICMLCYFISSAQTQTDKATNKYLFKPYKYITFNPLAIAEPQMAIGIGFGYRFTERSAFFTELSYVTKSVFYNTDVEKLNGFRFIGQYRFHFLQNSKQSRINSKREKQKPFIAMEFRLKNYQFPAKNTFVNYTTFDTIANFSTTASAISIGGAILFGAAYNISKNNKWKIELTAGIGAKQKIIHYKNLSANFEKIRQKGADALRPPEIDEEVGMPYFPIAVRLKYVIN